MGSKTLGGMRLAAAVAIAAMGSAAATGAAAMDKVRYGLSWLPQGEHCGFFQSLADGTYKKHGLDVELSAGGPGVNTSLKLATGAIDLAMGSSFTTMNLVAQNVPGVTVAAMLQKNPQTLVVHPDRGITKLEDLKDKRIMVANFSRNEFWQFLKQKYGFKDTQLAPYAYSAAPFLADKDAVQQGYITEDELLFGKQMKKPPVSFLLADYGYSAYASTIYTTAKLIAEKPDVVAKFVKASAEGYLKCVTGDYTLAKEAVMKANPEHSAELFDFKIAKMKEYGMVTGGDAAKLGVGAMTDARWKDFFDTMAGAGVYPKDLAWKKAFTLEFVNAKKAM